jgi:3-methyladenine DNA glycosylase Tag
MQGGRVSGDVIIGHDGEPRCAWAGAGDTALGGYHGEVWGTRTHYESAMFEALTLGVFQVGLSWAIVFAKRDALQGFRFVGPTSVYAFMQNVGVINDHIHGCFRATDYRTSH